MPEGTGTVFLSVLVYCGMVQDSPCGSYTVRDRVAKVKHPCASFCIWWSSFFALLHVNGQ